MALAVADLTIREVMHAYECCRNQKRSAWTAIDFEANFSKNIMEIYYKVKECTWKPSGHMCFVVMNPKPREVWASNFADRVVHHLVYNRLRPRFEPGWIATTFACIEGRGTSGASNWAEKAAKRVTRGWSKPAFVLQMDIRSFFPSIDRSHLHSLLIPQCHEDWVKHLVNEVVNVDVTVNAHFPGNQKLLSLIPAHKTLWKAKPGKGLPIGNLTSQFGANVYLSAIDQLMVRSKITAHYGRYVDDIVMMDADIGNLRIAYKVMVSELRKIGLTLHPQKTKCAPVADGFDFCGRFIKPRRTYLRRRTTKRAKLAMQNLHLNKHKGETVTSYLALARHCNGYTLRKKWAVTASQKGVVFMRNLTKARSIS